MPLLRFISSDSSTDRKKSPNQKRGFALVVALSLMAFVLLLLLSITTLVQVETQSSATSKRTMEARMNAQLGLQVAIGELQAALGPDARVSANASILDSNPSTAEIDDVSNEHWLGVYPTVNPADVNSGLLTPKALRDWSLSEVKWLVSVDDRESADPSVALSNDSVTLAQFIDDATTQIESLDDIENLSASSLSNAQAELLAIDGRAAQTNASGRYAWWVGDESMKARINTLASETGDEILSGSEVNTESLERSKYQVTQSTDFSTWLPGYADNLSDLDKVIATSELEALANSSGNTTWTKWSVLNQDKFTPYSFSLPTDVVNGRLKQDLTAYIKGSYAGLDGQSMIDPRFAISATRQPTFDLLKQWANMVDDHTTPQEVQAPNLDLSNPQHGLHPIVTQGAVAMKLSYIPLGNNTFNPVYLFMPQIQLLNPHNVALEEQDYIIQIGYQFRWWWQMNGTRGANVATFSGGAPEFRSWEVRNGQEPLPEHIPADNEDIDYQNNKRFFTFVIKDQAFKPGESLIFYAKPPDTGPHFSGVEYNLDRDTDILDGSPSDDEINLLWNEGSLEDSFFYVVSPQVGAIDDKNSKNKGIDLSVSIKAESNFRSNNTGSGASSSHDLDMHLNLYAFQDSKPKLLHAITKSQENTRYGVWYIPTYPLSRYQNEGNFDDYPQTFFIGRNPLINLGSSMLASNFDIFQGGTNKAGTGVNIPPKAGQPHATLGLWNIRNQESFSTSDEWNSGVEATEWLNTFSFRNVPIFSETWQYADSMYGNPSTDRLGGWWQSAVQGMAFPFFDYPTSPYGPASLGSFQHANLSVYGWQPTYAFGNAQAPSRFERSQFKDAANEDLYDVSYLLNASTWDSYYLSTIPQSGVALESEMRLPNSRYYLTKTDEESTLDPARLTNTPGFELSASNVLIHGGFNVNSTSKTAWEAFLSGAIGQQVETLHNNTDSNVETAAAMGRFLAPLLDEPGTVVTDRNTTDFEEANSWAATRTLNSDEITTLAARIVEEVKRRGPFLSLSDFVNRRLVPDTDVTGDERVYQEVLGTLQAAINKVTLEDQKINYHYYAFEAAGGSKMAIKPDQDWQIRDLHGRAFPFDVSDDAQESMFGLPKSKIDSDGGLIHNYAPNFLSQADLLTKIGPSITVRGDTFVIRSYGDSVDPITSKIIAKAWCEAVVQRLTKPVSWDGTDEKLIQPQDPDEAGFGREFKVVSFRWLTEQDVTPFSDDDAIVNL